MAAQAAMIPHPTGAPKHFSIQLFNNNLNVSVFNLKMGKIDVSNSLVFSTLLSYQDFGTQRCKSKSNIEKIYFSRI